MDDREDGETPVEAAYCDEDHSAHRLRHLIPESRDGTISSERD
jgi:hypothetical protein